MTDLRWCCRCQRVSDISEQEGAKELECPLCGAPAGNLQTWWSVRTWSPHWPEHPHVGKAYKIRDCSRSWTA